MANSGGSDDNAAQWFWSFIAIAAVGGCFWFGLFTSGNVGARVVGFVVSGGFLAVAVIMWIDAVLDTARADRMRRNSNEFYRLHNLAKEPIQPVSTDDDLEIGWSLPSSQLKRGHVPQPVHFLDQARGTEEDAD